MSGQDLYLEVEEKLAMLDEALRQSKKRGQEYAQTEHDYRVALAQQELIEREKGMPATLVSDIARGKQKIAKLKMQRDIAESMYRAALEAINVYKLQAKIINDQIDREWSKA